MLPKYVDDLVLIDTIGLLPDTFFSLYGRAMMEYQQIEVALMITRNWLVHRIFTETTYAELPEVMAILEAVIIQFQSICRLIQES